MGNCCSAENDRDTEVVKSSGKDKAVTLHEVREEMPKKDYVHSVPQHIKGELLQNSEQNQGSEQTKIYGGQKPNTVAMPELPGTVKAILDKLSNNSDYKKNTNQITSKNMEGSIFLSRAIPDEWRRDLPWSDERRKA